MQEFISISSQAEIHLVLEASQPCHGGIVAVYRELSCHRCCLQSRVPNFDAMSHSSVCSPTTVPLSCLAEVSWKKPPSNYTGDESDYEPSWLIAENLDQNSLASAFRQFPMEADPDRRIPPGGTKVKAKAMEDHARSWNDFSDDESEEDSEEEDEEMMENSSDDMQDCEEEESNKFGDVKDPGVSDLEESGK